MDVIIETGAGVTDANSYVGTDEAKEFAKARGLSFPCLNEDIQKVLFRGMDYIESFSHRFDGEKVLNTQSLSFPRVNCYVGCELIASDSIPSQLKQALIYTMVAFHGGFDPVANELGEAFVIREDVGPIRVDYAESSQHNRTKLRMVDKLLSQLFNQTRNVSFIKG